jgi:hypothetical protein
MGVLHGEKLFITLALKFWVGACALTMGLFLAPNILFHMNISNH